ncbi:MAG: ABC transporter substrate-binding protein [Synergistaceae bacterium]|jgi:branched-chain amino acid transport system substrate-binding protein|nr:ABC transporter substrate-binding protein [Synergistaceae bacterium]
MTKRFVSAFGIIAVIVMMVTFVDAVVPSSVHAAETVKIGWYGPTSGSNAQDGQDGRLGAEIARDLVNAEGGINGRQVEIAFADDKGDPKEGASIATKFASDKDIIGVAGPFNSSVMLAAAPIYNRAKLPNVGWGVSSPLITTAGDYIYRVQFTDSLGGDFVAKWMVEEEGFKKVAVVYENTDYGVGLLEVMRKSVLAYGGEIVAEASYMQGQTKDFSSIITSVKNAAPDAIFMGSVYNETALFCVQARDLGLTAPVFGTDGLFSDGLLDLGGAAVEGLRCFCVFFHEFDSPSVQKLVKAYGEKTGKIPSTWVALSYDATMAVIEAIRKTDARSREDVKKGLDNLGVFEGATGKMQFDENGDVLKDFSKIIVKDGKFIPYKK